MVMVSPTEKVAAWQGMQITLLGGKIMEAAPNWLPAKWHR